MVSELGEIPYFFFKILPKMLKYFTGADVTSYKVKCNEFLDKQMMIITQFSSSNGPWNRNSLMPLLQMLGVLGPLSDWCSHTGVSGTSSLESTGSWRRRASGASRWRTPGSGSSGTGTLGSIRRWPLEPRRTLMMHLIKEQSLTIQRPGEGECLTF